VKSKLLFLWVEDDPNDVILIGRGFKAAGLGPVHICSNGEDAMRYLKGEAPYDDRAQFPAPGLIITDLKMPRYSGMDLLRWVRSHATCQFLPVVVFSASGEARDIEEAYRLGASAYFQKPTGLDKIIEVVGKILAYWNEAIPPNPPHKC
jgi:CheY-like chemotaxis protein